MNTRLTSTVLLALALSIVPASGLLAADGDDQPAAPTREQLLELSRPGPEHAALAKFAGKWKVSMTMGTGQRARTSTGGGRSYMTLENRFLWVGYSTAGKAGRVKGSFTLGFDRRNQRYSLIAMDTHGTYFVTSHGKIDPKSGKIKMLGQDDDPHMKAMGFDKRFMHVADFTQPDRFVIEVYYLDTRKKPYREIKAIEFVFEKVE